MSVELRPIENINEVQLKGAVTELIGLAIYKGPKLKVEGVPLEKLRDSFVKAVEATAKVLQNKMTAAEKEKDEAKKATLLEELNQAIPERLASVYNFIAMTDDTEPTGYATEPAAETTGQAEEATAEAPPAKGKGKKGKAPAKGAEAKKTPEKAPEEKKEEKKTPPKAPVKAKEKKAPKEKKPPQKREVKGANGMSRIETFKAIMTAGGGTREEIAAAMLKNYGGKEAEAKFQTWNWTRLLINFGFAKEDDLGKVTLAKK